MSSSHKRHTAPFIFMRQKMAIGRYLLEVCTSRIKWFCFPSWVELCCVVEAYGSPDRRCALCLVGNHDRWDMLQEKAPSLDIHSCLPRMNSPLKCRKLCESLPPSTPYSPIVVWFDWQPIADYDPTGMEYSDEFYYAIPSHWFAATSRDWRASKANSEDSKLTQT